MYERFTDRARKVMQLANQEAERLGFEYIGTEHVLLGLIKVGSGAAAAVLKNLDVDLGNLQLDVENAILRSHAQAAILRSHAQVVADSGSPQRPRAKKAIEYAMEEAHKLGHSYLGSEHLLLGLLREADDPAALLLRAHGVTLERAREELAILFPAGPPSRPPPSAPRETEDLPAELVPIVAKLDAQIDRMTAATLKAVADQDFEMAASLHDSENQRLCERQMLLRDWFAGRRAKSAWLPELPIAVIELAGTIGDQQNWAALPQLADALEAAGCTDAELINHCRQPGEHSRNCWVVDLLIPR